MIAICLVWLQQIFSVTRERNPVFIKKVLFGIKQFFISCEINMAAIFGFLRGFFFSLSQFFFLARIINCDLLIGWSAEDDRQSRILSSSRGLDLSTEFYTAICERIHVYILDIGRKVTPNDISGQKQKSSKSHVKIYFNHHATRRFMFEEGLQKWGWTKQKCKD